MSSFSIHTSSFSSGNDTFARGTVIMIVKDIKSLCDFSIAIYVHKSWDIHGLIRLFKINIGSLKLVYKIE